MNIGIIGGTGWLGSAICKVLIEKQFVEPKQIWVSNRSGPNLKDAHSRVIRICDQFPNINYTPSNEELAKNVDLVILSVLPQDFSSVQCGDLSQKVVISVMAGVSISTIRRRTGAKQVIRALPNAACQFAESYTPWIADSAEQSTKDYVRKLFATLGTEDEVTTEENIDYLTSLTGGGPFLLSFFADAMIKHAQQSGLSSQIAERAVRQLFKGGGLLLSANEETPAETVASLIAYNGTTAQGLLSFQRSSIANDIGVGLQSSFLKAQDLSKQNEQS